APGCARKAFRRGRTQVATDPETNSIPAFMVAKSIQTRRVDPSMQNSTSPLRIAYLVPSLDVGGMERCVARLVAGLDPTRFSALVVSLTELGEASRWFDDRARLLAMHKQPGHDPSLFWRLAGVLREQRIDLVHSHNWGTLLEAVVARRCARVKAHVHAEHGTVLGDLGVSGLKRWLRRRASQWGMEHSNAVVCVSDATRRKLVEACGVAYQDVLTVDNGVPVPTTRPADRERMRRSLGLGEHALLVGSIGRLHEVKNFPALVGIVDQLNAGDHEVHLALVGDGPERDALAARAATLVHRDRVHLPGESDEVGAWLSAFDVYVNCSFSEGVSLGLLEAMAMGLPSVVTRVGDHAQVVTARSTQPQVADGADAACGSVVEPGDTEGLATALKALIADEPYRRALGANACRRHRRDFSVERMVTHYQELYESLLSPHLTARASGD
ncbi:MAG: glycosyltransferase, partial [Gammaproteobacteria bacterium]|nr:glycosyltransferase [Gammaproteobacteria bacterium]